MPDKRGLTREEISAAIRDGILCLGADYSVPRETQYSLFRTGYKATSYIDKLENSIFLGSVPGAPIIEKCIDDIRRNPTNLSEETLDFLEMKIEREATPILIDGVREQLAKNAEKRNLSGYIIEEKEQEVEFQG